MASAEERAWQYYEDLAVMCDEIAKATVSKTDLYEVMRRLEILGKKEAYYETDMGYEFTDTPGYKKFHEAHVKMWAAIKRVI